MSSSFWWNDEDFLGTVMKNNSKADPNLIIYLDSGDSGASQDGKNETISVKNKMISKYSF
jgi:predicted alpha/beta superfamily hydrolase